MSTYGPLTGTGIQALSAGVGSLHVHVNTLPTVAGEGNANPPNWYHVGLIRAGDGTAWWRPIPIEATDAWIEIPNGATELGYWINVGGSITVTEVIGNNPFAGPAGSSGPAGPAGPTGPTGPAGSSGATSPIHLLLNWASASNVGPTAMTDSAFADITGTSQNFTVASETSLIEIRVTGYLRVGGSANPDCAIRAVVDATNYVLSGEAMSGTTRSNILAGAGSLFVSLTAGAHTIKLQAKATGSGNDWRYYGDGSFGALRIQVLEHPQ